MKFQSGTVPGDEGYEEEYQQVLKDLSTDLNDYVKSLIKNKNKYYVFLDEIQKVEEFEKGIKIIKNLLENNDEIDTLL